MPTVALPVTAGTTRAAGLHPDHRANEQAATPFASLLDTGVTPNVPDRPAARSDRPQQPDKPSRAENSDQKPERPAAASDAAPATDKGKAKAGNKTEAKGKTETGNDTDAKAKLQGDLEAADVAQASDDSTETDGAEPEKTDHAEGDTTSLDLPPVVDTSSGAPPADTSAPVAPNAPVVADPTASAPVAVAVQPAPPTPVATDAPKAADSDATTQVVAIGTEKKADVVAPGQPEQQPAIATKADPKPKPAAEATAKSDVPASTDEPETAPAKEKSVDALSPKTDAASQPHQPIDGEKHAQHSKTAAEKPAVETATSDKTASPASAHRADVPTTVQHADIVAQANAPLPAPASASPQAVSQAPAAAAAPAMAAVPISGVAVEIVTQAKEGKSRFEIRLDPPDLGRIDVRLDVDGQGNVTSRLVVERQDTLDLLRRESSALERALNDAGLKTGNDGLQFSLRDQGYNGDTYRDSSGNGRAARVVVPTDAGVGVDPSAYRLPRLGGLDIRV